MGKDLFKLTASRHHKIGYPWRDLLLHELVGAEDKVLDYGCGHFDIKHQLSGYNITGYDKFNQDYTDVKVLGERYDIVCCFYVFNIIEKIADHREVLKLLKGLGDNIYIAVRKDKERINFNWKWSVDRMAYWTGKNWQRFYDKSLIRLLFGAVEYITDKTSLKYYLFRLK